MKKTYPNPFNIIVGVLIFLFFFVWESGRVETQTLGLSGSTINIAVVPASTATALVDSVQNTHANILAITKAEIKAAQDTTTNVHKALRILEKADIDSITGAHSNILTKIKVNTDSITQAETNIRAWVKTISAGVFYEQADAAVTVTAIADSETTVLNLRTAGTRYALRNLVLKSADPGVNTVTVRLYEYVNDAFIVVSSFAITTSNYTVYYNIYSLFGNTQLFGDNLMITVRDSAGTAAITGQYSWAKSTN
jgi:hypothetical protein